MRNMEAVDLVSNLKEMAKEIALSIPKCELPNDLDQLHRLSLDLLVGLTELECRFLQSLAKEEVSFRKETNMSSIDEDHELKKLKNRLPRWAINRTQINSRILILFLSLRNSGAAVTVNALRTAYGNASEFDKNFPQMKMISERNHGKVFEVIDGVVEIWPKAKGLVEDFERHLNSVQ